MRCALAIAFVTIGCGGKTTPAPPTAPPPTPTTTANPQVTTPTPTPTVGGDCVVDAIAERIAKEWGTPDVPKASFAGPVKEVSKRVESYDRQRRAWVDELRPHGNGPLACAAAAHVEIGVVDDTFRSAVLHAKLEAMPPDSNAKLVELETKANKMLADPNSTAQTKENAKTILAKAREIRDSVAETARTALKGWSAYAEMELIDNYARGMIEARKAGLKGSIYASAWKRMGVVVGEVGAETVDERLSQVKKDHPDVPIDAKAFASACSWPAGC